MFTSCGLLRVTGPQPSPESVNDRDAEEDLTHGGATEGLQSGSRFLQCWGVQEMEFGDEVVEVVMS